jgi:S1-C subfamily serine protease
VEIPVQSAPKIPARPQLKLPPQAQISTPVSPRHPTEPNRQASGRLVDTPNPTDVWAEIQPVTGERKNRNSQRPIQLLVGIGGAAAAVALIGIGVLFVMWGGSGPSSPPQAENTTTSVKPKPALPKPEVKNSSKPLPVDPPAVDPPAVNPPAVNPPVVVKETQPVPLPKSPTKHLPDQIAPDAVARVKKATVFLRVTTTSGMMAEGSGFLAVEPGIVITNAHVLGMLGQNSLPPQSVSVYVSSGEPEEKKLSGKILGVDRESDLAVVRVEGDLPDPLPLDWANPLFETQRVYIFGFPFGEQLGKNITVSPSEISSLRKDPTGTLERIQVNGGMHPGNSGGPVVNALGEVIGVSVAGIKGTQINFAVPARFVDLLAEGRPIATKLGEPYLNGQTVHLDVTCRCLDPFDRINKADAWVWTGAPGPPRPFSAKEPRALPGDGPPGVHDLQYGKAVGHGDIPLPKTAAGQVVWVRPVVTSASGQTQWGPAQPIDPSLPVQRQPGNLIVNMTTNKQRTVAIKTSQTLRFLKGKETFTLVDQAEASLLESIFPQQDKYRVSTAIRVEKLSFEKDGQVAFLDPEIPLVLQRVPPHFFIDDMNQLVSRSEYTLDRSVPLPVRDGVDTYHGLICKCYQSCTIPLPNKLMSPRQSWICKVPVPFKAENRVSVYDLELTCTYEGLCQRMGRKVGVVTVVGRLEGRGELRGRVNGVADGRFIFDIDGGFIASARITAITEIELDESLQVVAVFEASLDRTPGNPAKLQVPNKLAPVAAGVLDQARHELVGHPSSFDR